MKKDIMYEFIGVVVTLLMYFGMCIPLYLFTSLEFVQSPPCQALLMIWFFVAFAVGAKITMRLDK